MLFKLAWRNIWRNKRRTYITAASILFAVLFATFMEALQDGAWKNMINNVVNYYYSYAQIHRNGYWDEQSIDKAFHVSDSLNSLLENLPNVKNTVPRIESFALASTGNKTKGVMVVGVEPATENSLTSLADRLVSGQYFKQPEEVLIAEGISDYLDLKVGDTLVLISQGYHGVNAAGKFPVGGIVHLGAPQLNQQMVYLPLPAAQWFYGAEDLVTSLALKIESPRNIDRTVKALKNNLSQEDYEVMKWQEMLPDLVQAKALDDAGNYIVYFILYMIIAFGIFGTILMMTKERAYEFGILTAIGMRRAKLAAVIWIEIIMLGLLGTIAGILASIPVVAYFKKNPIRFQGEYAGLLEKFGFEPIFPAAFEFGIFFSQAVVVFLITAILALYPVWKIQYLQPVEAMRS